MTVHRSELQAPVGAVFDRSTEGSVERNLQPIKEVLSCYFASPEVQNVLELASGFGCHVTSWAEEHRSVRFQPTDRDPESVSAAAQLVQQTKLPNVEQPKVFDVLDDARWSSISCKDGFDMIVCINLIHVSPWAVTEALFKHINEVLKHNKGFLVFYGAFKVDGVCEDSNVLFDESLRKRDPRFGLRNLEDIQELANGAGLVLVEKRDMPSNNSLIVFQREHNSAH